MKGDTRSGPAAFLRPAYEPIEFDQVADIYDLYVKADFDIPFWLEEAGSVSGKVLELTCGTGRVSIPLLKAGVDLTCVDYAGRMLEQLRRKLAASNLSCNVYCQDLTKLRLDGRFDLIFIPFHSFSEVLRREHHKDALARIHEHLNPGGRFVCSLHNPIIRINSMGGLPAASTFPLPDGRTLVMRSTVRYDPETQIASGEQRYEWLSGAEVVDRRSLGISFYLFRAAEFRELAEKAGFGLDAVYGNYDRTPFEEKSSPYMIWKTVKVVE